MNSADDRKRKSRRDIESFLSLLLTFVVASFIYVLITWVFVNGALNAPPPTLADDVSGTTPIGGSELVTIGAFFGLLIVVGFILGLWYDAIKKREFTWVLIIISVLFIIIMAAEVGLYFYAMVKIPGANLAASSPEYKQDLQAVDKSLKWALVLSGIAIGLMFVLVLLASLSHAGKNSTKINQYGFGVFDAKTWLGNRKQPPSPSSSLS